MADIVPTTLNVVVVRDHVRHLVPDLPRAPVTVDGEIAWALQLPMAVNAVDVAASSFVALPGNGGPLFWNRIAFYPDVHYPDVFWLQEENRCRMSS